MGINIPKNVGKIFTSYTATKQYKDSLMSGFADPRVYMDLDPTKDRDKA